MNDWVGQNDLARFVVEAMEGADTRLAQANARGTGHAQYPPAMMVALLISSDATDTFSSRAMERQTYDSVATRFICADHHPDPDTMAKFRRENGPLLKSCFVEVLQLAKTMGLLRLGTVGVDGTSGRRAASIGPWFHVIKRLMGFGRFMLRGLKKVNLEGELVAIADTCRKLAPHGGKKRENEHKRREKMKK